MREIKFRAWDNVRKKMFYKLAIEQTAELNIWIANDANNEYFTLMQYTGLKDKNGVEIYEGDILSTPTKATSNFIVSFGGQSAAFYYSGWNFAGQKRFHRILNRKSLENRIVIGNRYENPDLLTPTPSQELANKNELNQTKAREDGV